MAYRDSNQAEAILEIGSDFRKAGGAGKEAYLILDRLFTDNENRESFMALENEYQALLARTWMPDAENVNSMAKRMEQIRRAQIALISNKITDPETGESRDIGEFFQRAKAQARNLDESERGNLRIMENHYLYLSAFKKDPRLTDRYINTLKNSSTAWADTLEIESAEQAWKAQQPAFEASFAVLRESMKEPARLLSERLGRPVPLSEAALNQLNPGVTNRDITKALEAMKPRYKELVARIREQAESGNAPTILPLPEIPSEVQLRIFRRLKDEILKGAGYDERTLKNMGAGILFTTSTTGTCWGHSKDIVLSIETYPEDIAKGLGNTWHEAYHLLYFLEMNRLPPEIRGKPVATFNGFGVHEVAALTGEQTGLRKKAFELISPILKEELTKAKAEGLLPAGFDPGDPALTAENLYLTANRPNLSDMEWCTSELALAPNMAWRANAFRKIFDGELEIRDLPEFWAKEMTEWTGIRHDAKDFRIGEDHIFSGLGGYFWSYMTGVFTATALQNEIAAKGLAPDAEATDLASYSAPYSKILRERIFAHASKDAPDALLEKALGRSVWDRSIVKAYLERLSAPAKPGSPAPDEILAAKYPAAAENPENKSQP